MADLDYEALAKQFGGATAAPPAAGGVDYDALATQFGGGAAAAVAPAPTPAGEGMPTGREPDNSAAQWLGITNRALAPYATAAGAGALAGAPFGGVGAPVGAAMGVTALGIGDIGTSLYNIGAGYLGGKRVPLPSETIQDVYGSIGVGREPVTTGQKIYSGAISGAAGGFAPAKAINELAPLVSSPTVRNVMRELATQPVGQAVIGAGAGAAPEITQAAGIEDPRLIALSSLVGGAAAAKGAGTVGRAEQAMESTAKRLYEKVTGAPTSTVEELKSAANAAYQKANASGITFTPKSYSNMVIDLNDTLKQEGFDPDLSPRVAKAVNILENRQDTPQSLTELDNARKIVAQLKVDPDPNTRRLAGIITDKIDEFVTKSGSNAVSTGTPEGIAALNEGRSMWARMRKSEAIEDILNNVDLRIPGAADTIRSQFATLAANKRRMLGFSEAEQAAIRRIAEGNATPTTLNIISKLAPGIDLKGLLIGGALASSTAFSGTMSPMEAAALGLVGLGAKGARNYLAKRNVSNLAAGIRRGDVQMPYAVQPNAMISPISQQFLNSLANQTGQ